jgi:MOSC domain-containing protein YiiM
MLPGSADPRLVSVNVGAIRELTSRGRLVRTGIWKEPVGSRAVRIGPINLDGDDQADRTVHGGVHKAVYAYAAEDYEYWSEHEGVVTSPGLFGENLTLTGVDLSLARVGERWQVGTALLEVTQPRLPCYKLGIRLGDSGFPRRFVAVARFGAYLRVMQEGEVRAGDAIRISPPTSDSITLREMAAEMLGMEAK